MTTKDRLAAVGVAAIALAGAAVSTAQADTSLDPDQVQAQVMWPCRTTPASGGR